MRIAVVVEQLPALVELLKHDGRLVRDGVPLEVNALCRRADAKAVELAGTDGEVVAFTMWPPAADECLEPDRGPRPGHAAAGPRHPLPEENVVCVEFLI